MILRPSSASYPALVGVLAGVFLAGALFCLLRPRTATRLLRAFPRNRAVGWVLAAVAMAWTTLWMPIVLREFFPALAPRLLPHLQVFFVLSTLALGFVLENLLACRAAGLLFVLLPAPIFSAAQGVPSAWRLVPVVVGYAFAFAGMFIVARPWLLRDAMEWGTGSAARLRSVPLAFFALGIALALAAVLA